MNSMYFTKETADGCTLNFDSGHGSTTSRNVGTLVGEGEPMKIKLAPEVEKELVRLAKEIMLKAVEEPKEITYEQVLDYCSRRNLVLVDGMLMSILRDEKCDAIWGVPLEEAKGVIDIYKFEGTIPTKDYQEGFEAGVKHTKAIYEKTIDDLIMNVCKK